MRTRSSVTRAFTNVFPFPLPMVRALYTACLLLLFCAAGVAQTPISGQPVASLSQLDTIMQKYMVQYSSPGATLAVTVDGRLVFARGYGYAKVDTGEFTQPDSLFRIASNSKPITAAGIYKLIEQGKLSLTTQPFATILNKLTPPSGTTIDPRFSSITIQDLLQHTAGFDDTIAPDPAQSDAVIAATTFGAPAPATPELLIKYILGQSLQHDPGTTYAYSNLGYITLGYIIEQVSGESYAKYIQDNVFTPAGIKRTQPGASLLAGRLPDEVAYYDYPGAPLASSVEPPVGTEVPYPYGGYSCTLQLANGCWVSSTLDLLRFTDSINGQFSTSIFSTPPSSNPFRTPQLYFAVPPSGSGWEYVFYGSLPGTNSLTHLITDTTTTGKVTYSAIFNTRDGSNIEQPESDADNAILAFVKTVKTWPTGDLFPSYAGSASSCSFTLAATSQSVPVNGNTFTVGVTDANFCAWSSVSSSSWIHVTSGSLNSDSGSTGFTVDANTGGPRTGTIAIAGHTFTVTQIGVTTLTSLTIGANPTSVMAGQPVTLTATLAPFSAGSNTTNGETVTFMTGGTAVGTAKLASGVATLSTTALPGGTDSVIASYAGDSTFSAANSASVQVIVSKAAATVTLGGLAATYDGNPHAATATTTPAGLSVTFTYAGSSTAPTNAGTYAVVATISDPKYTGTASGSLVITKGAAKVTLGNLSATADGTAHAATATTVPAGLSVAFTYNGSATAPSAAGSYTVVGTVNDPNYKGTATGTLVIGVPLVASSTTLASSAPSAAVGSNITFTATVTGAGGQPTGTVTFSNGTTALGTGTLSTAGVVTFRTSFSTAGTISLTAQYGGDAAFKGSTSSPLSETIVPVGITATVTPNPLTIKSGSSGTLSITLTPTGGYTGMVSFSCGMLPTNASCTFAPTTVAITAGMTTATDMLTISTTKTSTLAMLSDPQTRGQSGGVFSALVLGVPGSLIALFGLKRRKQHPGLRRLWLVALFSVATLGAGALIGCGGGGNSNTTKAGSYSIPVNLTIAGGATQSVNATVIVQ